MLGEVGNVIICAILTVFRPLTFANGGRFDPNFYCRLVLKEVKYFLDIRSQRSIYLLKNNKKLP